MSVNYVLEPSTDGGYLVFVNPDFKGTVRRNASGGLVENAMWEDSDWFYIRVGSSQRVGPYGTQDEAVEALLS